MRFFVGDPRSGGRVVELPEPECLYCGAKNFPPSMDGPLVCPPCDMGINADGSKWTMGEYLQRAAHFKDRMVVLGTVTMTPVSRPSGRRE